MGLEGHLRSIQKPGEELSWQNIILPVEIQPAFEIYSHLKSTTGFQNNVADMLLRSPLPNIPLITQLPTQLVYLKDIRMEVRQHIL